MSTKPKLPAIPEPAVLKKAESEEFTDDTAYKWAWFAHGYDTGMEPYFSVEQVRSLLLQAVKEERERCAELCIGKAKHWIELGPSLNWEFRAHGAEECAEAIRSLPDPD